MIDFFAPIRKGKGLSESKYAYVDPDGRRHLPIGDAAHARNALARFGQTFFESESAARTAWGKILRAAKRFGIKHEGAMPTPKVRKSASEGRKVTSAEPEGVTMARRKELDVAADGDAEKSLAEIVAGLEELFPQMEKKQILEMAMGALDDDDDYDSDTGVDDEAAEEPTAAEPGAEGPYDSESAEQMAARHAEEMAKCASDGERAECAARHKMERERFARRVRERAARREEHMGSRKSKLSQEIARHPMVVRMAQDLNRMREEQARKTAENAADAAIREGRLVPSQREWAIEYCSVDPQGFEKFIAKQPKILEQGPSGTFTGRMGEASAETLSQKEVQICTNLGISEEKFIAARKARTNYSGTLN